ncbi:CDP-alcohol phosphatidyltransferase family protein [Arachidicoccus terrestris]|uniref:CDP-alcohol phosphatidyltransferase family protein n=1 Tax=Arachidicoccus terrestris TaxID=2875539 RepID=UPI001CC38909|nr:CDP-alcohol phosphatidyltransferase family protein [Arachidicoccus terrestris]UAY54034.1 CDP-alcohol phosphatidyltransferase family protein [Arachidicoccus terrestris]
MRRHIANCFTLLNLVFGCLAVIQILQGVAGLSGGHEDAVERMQTASMFICLAAVVDFLDGLIARLLAASSEMGKQLDSLADLVSFGLAPGLILYEFLQISFAATRGVSVNYWYLLPALLIPCAGAYRLARFNLGTGFSTEFEGLPIPAGGILIASFPLIYLSSSFNAVQRLLQLPVFWYALIFIVSFLMVSTLPMMSLKFKNLSFVQNWPKFLLFVLAVICGLILHWLAVPVVFLVYTLLSLILIRKS